MQYFDAMRELRIIRQDIEDDFIESFYARFSHGVPRESGETTELSLNFDDDRPGLDEKNDLEENLAMSNMVSEARSACRHSLFLLDKRIGFILLGRIKSTKAFAFFFLPVLAVFSGFLSAHALVALLIPVLMGVYKVTCKIQGVEKDQALAVFLLLGVCFASNHGGPGSPAAGGRNAIMVRSVRPAPVPPQTISKLRVSPFTTARRMRSSRSGTIPMKRT